jgi:hypothetical protein
MIVRIPIAFLFLALVGCGGPPGGGASPTDAFEKYKAAAAKENYKVVFQCMDPDEADSRLLSVLLVAGTATFKDKRMENDMSGILGKYGAADAPEKIAPMQLIDEDARRALAHQIFGRVRDKAGLYASMVRRLSDVKGFTGFPLPIRDDSSLDELTTEDATARGTIVQPDGATTSLAFVRRGSNWYLVAPTKKGF